MKKHLLSLTLLLLGGVAFADDNALIDLLVKKKILTPKEAKEVRAEHDKEKE